MLYTVCARNVFRLIVIVTIMVKRVIIPTIFLKCELLVFQASPIVLLLTSLSNWDRGASPAQSMPPPDESEPSEGEVIVCRLLEP